MRVCPDGTNFSHNSRARSITSGGKASFVRSINSEYSVDTTTRNVGLCKLMRMESKEGKIDPSHEGNRWLIEAPLLRAADVERRVFENGNVDETCGFFNAPQNSPALIVSSPRTVDWPLRTRVEIFDVERAGGSWELIEMAVDRSP